MGSEKATCRPALELGEAPLHPPELGFLLQLVVRPVPDQPRDLAFLADVKRRPDDSEERAGDEDRDRVEEVEEGLVCRQVAGGTLGVFDRTVDRADLGEGGRSENDEHVRKDSGMEMRRRCTRRQRQMVCMVNQRMRHPSRDAPVRV